MYKGNVSIYNQTSENKCLNKKGRLMIYLITIFYLIIGLLNIKLNSKYQRKIFSLVLALPMFVMSAFRNLNVGPDTINYHNFFYRIGYANNLGQAMENSRLESGYVALNYFISRLGGSYFVFQIIVSFFIYYSLAKFINEYSLDLGMSYFLFWINFQAFGTMNQVRMWIAIMITIRSTKYLMNREFTKFIFVVLIASQFHLSALIFAIMYPLTKQEINIKNILVVMIISIILRIFFLPIMTYLTTRFNVYGTYLTESRLEKNKISLVLSLIVHFGYFIFIVLTNPKIFRNAGLDDNPYLEKSWDESISVYIVSFWALVVMLGLSIVGLTFNMVGRLIHFFSIYLLILIPIGFGQIKSKNNKFILKCMIFIILVLQFIVIMIYRPEWYQVVDYEIFF